MNKQWLPASFKWLNITQFLGALNDNVFKLLVIFCLLAQLGDAHRATVVGLTSFIFVLPFLLFSQAAGVLADRISKRSVIISAKALEVVVMVLGCVAIYAHSRWGLYTAVALMSTQSAVFGPAKYGVIPELVSTEKLSRANSLLVGLTYLAIIIGTFLPTFLLLKIFAGNFLLLGGFCVAVSIAGLLASLQIGKTPAAGSDKKFSPWFPLEIARTIRASSKDRYLLFAIIGAAYFLLLGGFIQQNALLYGQEHLGLSFIQSGYLFSLAAFGIGIGAYLAGVVSGRNIEFGVVPVGATGLTLGCIALGIVPPSLKWVVTAIFITGISSGLFIVPLNAFIQYRSPQKTRGQVLACTSFLGFLGVAISAGLLILLSTVLGVSAKQSFLIIGMLTGALAIASVYILPDFLIRFMVVVVTRIFYRIQVRGIENVPVDGPALLVPNHVTWVDSLFLAATMQRRIRFIMARKVCEEHPLRWVFKLMKAIPIAPDDPPREIVKALKGAREALDEGYLVCIFAEGRLTRNGNMQAFKAGFEKIVKGTDYPVVPVHIRGGWGSIFCHWRGKLMSTFPKRIPYPVTISYGVAEPSSINRHLLRQRVLELSTEYVNSLKNSKRTLCHQFVRAARRLWFRPAVHDTTGKRLSFGKTLAGAIALGTELSWRTVDQTRVGVLLPASVGGALTNLALTLKGKIPVNLNFTASRDHMLSAIEQSGIETIVSSRRFIENVEGLEAPPGTLYLEEIAPSITTKSKLCALMKAIFAPVHSLMERDTVAPDDIATIIFSSGSTGQPKGVMLTHHNIISNVEGFRDVYGFRPADGMCAALPFFHSFGFTATLWCPMLTGFRVSYHPNPVDGPAIAELVREEKLTIMLATPTFLLVYLRRAKKEDFASLRTVVTGAEKLKTKLSDSFEEHFGIRPMEGYGATELSPVVALNVKDVTIEGITHIGTKEGSVGHPIPGIAARVVDLESGEFISNGETGLLQIRGPNVMRGYLGMPEKTAETVVDGWYNTGDIARIDDDGFIFLLDRLSRYSKIGGEMVPHIGIEDAILKELGTVEPVVAVTGAPDERKGEQIVVFYTAHAGEVEDIVKAVESSDLPNLWRPKKNNYVYVDAIPSLGTGKTDLAQLKKMAQDVVENRPGLMQKALNRIRESL